MIYVKLLIPHSGNLSREKTFENLWKMGFQGENFRGLLSRTVYIPPSLQTIVDKTFTDRHKTAKFAKVFSLESFPLYGNLMTFGLSSFK